MEKSINVELEVEKTSLYYDEDWVKILKKKHRSHQWAAFTEVVNSWVREVHKFNEDDLLKVADQLREHVKDLQQKRMLTDIHREYFRNTIPINKEEAYTKFSDDILKMQGFNLSFANIDYLRKRVAELEVDLSLRKDESK